MAAIELDALADWIETRLGNENADRQTICEDAAARLRQLAAAHPPPVAADDQRVTYSIPLDVIGDGAAPGDQRVAYAREFLASARKRKVTELPPSVLMRELAECRRQLGQGLDVIGEQAATLDVAREALLGQAAALDDGQLVVLGQALGDAISYRTPEGFCKACETWPLPAGICPDHEADVSQAEVYLALARELGLEIER